MGETEEHAIATDSVEVITDYSELIPTGAFVPVVKDYVDEEIIDVEIESSVEIQISEKETQIEKLRLEIDALKEDLLKILVKQQELHL